MPAQPTAPNSEREMLGSSLRDTHRAADDPWAALEGLAKAATPGPWSYRDMRPSTYGPAFVDAADVQSLAICGEAVGRSDTHGFCLRVDSEVRMSNAAFIAAANPATVLKLIEAARASQVGMSEANEPSKDEIIQRQGEEIERLRKKAANNWDEYIAERKSRMEHGAREAGYQDQIERLRGSLDLSHCVVEAALEAAWFDVAAGGSSGFDALDDAVAAYQLATGVAQEQGPEAVAACLARTRQGGPDHG